MTLTQEFENSSEWDLSRILQSINEFLQLDKRLTQAKKYAEEHPLITLFWVVTMAMCSIPVICFCTFVCASVVLAVAGFVLIEGTLISVATVLLGGALLLAGLLALGFSCSLVIGYYTFTYSLDMVQGVSEQMKQRRENTVTKTSAKSS